MGLQNKHYNRMQNEFTLIAYLLVLYIYYTLHLKKLLSRCFLLMLAFYGHMNLFDILNKVMVHISYLPLSLACGISLHRKKHRLNTAIAASK